MYVGFFGGFLTPELARRWLLHSAALFDAPPTTTGLLDRLGCIQLDPIDRYGSSAELVAWARIPGLQRGDLNLQLRNKNFEHFAKERCLIHPRFFSAYRGQALETPWWRASERQAQLSKDLLAEVVAEVRERGPIRAEELSDRGGGPALDWSGWKSTSKRSSLAAELLWTTCALVVAARDRQGRRLYDVPERALSAEALAAPPPQDIPGFLVEERVRSAGLLSRAGGPQWSMLGPWRQDGTVERLLKDGRLEEHKIGRRPYLSLPIPPPAGLPPLPEGPLRVLAPLDPLLWDRRLIAELFDFDYVWEIYKPEAERRWGYYVCPLLRGERLVGRIEARRDGSTLRLTGLWWEPGARRDDQAELGEALERLAAANGCTMVDLTVA